MSELCSSSTTPHDSKFHTLLLNDIFFFLSFILSHPLYFSYFIFFSPYLLKLLSFLSPLFLTTILLILSLLIHSDSTLKSLQSNSGFLLNVIKKLGSKIIQENHEEMCNFEEFEVYKIVFNPTPMFDNHVVKEIVPIEVSDSDSDCVTKFCTHEVSSVTMAGEERKLESFLQLLDKFENMGKEQKVVDQPPCSKSNKIVGELQKEDLLTGSEAATPIKVPINDNDCSTVNGGGEYTSKVTSNGHLETINNAYNGGEYKLKITSNGHLEKINEADNNGGEYTSKVSSNGHLEKINDDGYSVGEYALNLDSSRSFDSSKWSYGSMRKEKEWKRTLACKLFEERHNGGGEDGMDSLWEAYEKDSGRKESKKVMTKSKSDTDAYAYATMNVNVNVKKNNKKYSGLSEYYYDFEEEEDDYELTNGKICCLQALKMSSGKMNFGMGKSNFVKISKALKGMGWIHNVSRHGKRR